MKLLGKCWYQPDLPANFLVWLLLPLSWLYCAAAVVRRKSYQLKLKKSYAARVPVVVIGNIVVGGSGKTPLLISVCEFIKKNGFKPGVVSRGYGGKVAGVKQVLANDPAELVGDEPLMICQRTKVPVVVGADRVAAVSHLLENNQCDIVLSDDGLQHYRMQRDIEIAVIDSNRGFGNGFCLPAGPLRERVSRLKEVDMVVYNGVDGDFSGGANSESTEVFSYTLKIVDLCHLSREECVELSSFMDKPVHAVAGIGNPLRFFAQLRDNGIDVIEHAFSDHHAYTQADFSGWDNDCIIMTEKDAVKCRDLSLPDAWVVNIIADISESLETQLNSKILPLLNR
ncbi:MAG: tetraacyldisaccharide 4'-kinase [Gammaproteobacteria bacterium]|nr:MAG: tetraacyldisaccharide 4'-kinase [Gammaproteobacteria bacterium]